MRTISLLLAILASALPAQMEKRTRLLYDRAAFRRKGPVPGSMLPSLVLEDLSGKKIDLLKLTSKKRLIIIGGAYT